MNPHKIIYFDRETIQNILQEKHKGTRTKTSGTSNEAELSASLGAEASAITTIGVPLVSRIKFIFTGKLDTKFLLKHDSTTTITSTEISDFESIKDNFTNFQNQQVYDVENSSTFFRVAGGYLKMLGNNIEGVNIKEFQSVMESFEGYDVYKISDTVYVRFNHAAFVSNYKRNDLLTTKITMYCVSVGCFKTDDFDFVKQLTKMQHLATAASTAQTISELYPPANPVANTQSEAQNDNSSGADTSADIEVYDVVYAHVAQKEDKNT